MTHAIPMMTPSKVRKLPFLLDVIPEPGITPLALSTSQRLLYLVPEVALGNNR